MLRGLGDDTDAGGTTELDDQRITAPRLIRLVVPGVCEAPFVGGGCCSVVPAEVALAEAIVAWPGVRAVEVNVASGWIDVQVEPPGPAEEDLTGTVFDLGYEVEAVGVLDRR